MIKSHSLHIPVMGIGFTLETPLKVSQFGIDSVISLGDDILLEKLRKMYCGKYKLPYQEISSKSEDSRAKRITSYLNMIQGLANKEFEKLKSITAKNKKRITDYISLLPDDSKLKTDFQNLTSEYFDLKKVKAWIKDNLSMGSIDVNVMTKIDKTNYQDKEKLPIEFNDAHAAVRGFANSSLRSSIILSAGLSPRLFSYMEQFQDFHADENGVINKKIVLKVSDFRSALIQGKFLAKKGLWVSEYRIESGLNCGGHAFATDGYLLGPILNEFKEKREELTQTIFDVLSQTLSAKNAVIPKSIPPLKITVQGGVGTAAEHQFLIEQYNIDSVGWGTPFLLVPEATTVDKPTLDKLINSTEKDLYLSNISPLGVPFNSLRENTKDMEKNNFINKGRPGSSCPKKFLALNTEFTEEAICTASRQYQHLKIKELEKKAFPESQHELAYKNIVEKACICVGLGTSTLLVNGLDTKVEGEGVSICPGPNLAYFSKKMSLKQMVNHIYGRGNEITRTDRPNMFVKELFLYMDYLKKEIEQAKINTTASSKKYLTTFLTNLEVGINYYIDLFNDSLKLFAGLELTTQGDLEKCKMELQLIKVEVEDIHIPK